MDGALFSSAPFWQTRRAIEGQSKRGQELAYVVGWAQGVDDLRVDVGGLHAAPYLCSNGLVDGGQDMQAGYHLDRHPQRQQQQEQQ